MRVVRWGIVRGVSVFAVVFLTMALVTSALFVLSAFVWCLVVRTPQERRRATS
jgi:hypothetical protein